MERRGGDRRGKLRKREMPEDELKGEKRRERLKGERRNKVKRRGEKLRYGKTENMKGVKAGEMGAREGRESVEKN